MSTTPDDKLLRQLADELAVQGIKKLKIRRNNSLQVYCDACPDVIVLGRRHIRVVYLGAQGREHFHISCFRSEFTNAEAR